MWSDRLGWWKFREKRRKRIRRYILYLSIRLNTSINSVIIIIINSFNYNNYNWVDFDVCILYVFMLLLILQLRGETYESVKRLSSFPRERRSKETKDDRIKRWSYRKLSDRAVYLSGKYCRAKIIGELVNGHDVFGKVSIMYLFRPFSKMQKNY